MGMRDIAAAHHRSVAAVQARLTALNAAPPKADAEWGETEDALLLKRAGEGVPLKDIAALHRRTLTAVTERIAVLRAR